jgi:hypothetical protein
MNFTAIETLPAQKTELNAIASALKCLRSSAQKSKMEKPLRMQLEKIWTLLEQPDMAEKFVWFGQKICFFESLSFLNLENEAELKDNLVEIESVSTFFTADAARLTLGLLMAQLEWQKDVNYFTLAPGLQLTIESESPAESWKAFTRNLALTAEANHERPKIV